MSCEPMDSGELAFGLRNRALQMQILSIQVVGPKARVTAITGVGRLLTWLHRPISIAPMRADPARAAGIAEEVQAAPFGLCHPGDETQVMPGSARRTRSNLTICLETCPSTAVDPRHVIRPDGEEGGKQ